jgi:hypothetical protein
MDVNQATALLEVSYANANDIVADMERLGLLREATAISAIASSSMRTIWRCSASYRPNPAPSSS